MATIRLDLSSEQIRAAATGLPGLAEQIPWIAAKAMTRASTAARKDIVTKIYPRIEGGPTRWTRGGLISSMARPDDLRTQVGFRLGQGRFEDELGARGGGSGVPAGEYMTTGVKGIANRKPKSTEKTLIGKRILGLNQRIIPNPNQLKNKNGNVSGSTLKSIVNKIQMPGEVDALKQQATMKKRGKGRRVRKQFSDYFVMRMKDQTPVNRHSAYGIPSLIAKRVGVKKRGIAVVLLIVNRASYKRRFPIDDVAMKEFARQFDLSYTKELGIEIKRRMKK